MARRKQRIALPRRVAEAQRPELPSAIVASSRAKPVNRSATLPGCFARFTPSLAQDRFGNIRLANGRVALVSSRSKGAASSSGLFTTVESVMVINCFRLLGW